MQPPELWKSGPWTERYDFRAKLGEGGQGYTFHAVTKADAKDVAVKILRPDRNTPKARRRMAREVNALRLLSKTTASVPRFVESNIDEAIELPSLRSYVVMEFIQGDTLLRSQQRRGPLSLADGIAFTNLLLTTVAIAHSEDTTHRDIKPQNIVLKGDDYAQPYLIDFGLSFNSVLDLDDGLTSIRESIGNKFLTLPESEQTGSELKHEFATDLTLICGVLFFVLTDKFPEFLSRDQSNAPHKRFAEIIKSNHGDNSQFLAQFFDRAFQYDVTRRFQTSEELRDRLHRLKDQSEGQLPNIDPLDVAKELSERIAAENRTFQLDAIEKQHGKSLNDFQKYVQTLAQSKQLAPIRLSFSNEEFGNRVYNGYEVIRSSICMIQIATPGYYQKTLACRYFLTISGEEIAVQFQELQPDTKLASRRVGKQFAEVPIKTLLTFYEWDNALTETLKKHFANWFHHATQELTV